MPSRQPSPTTPVGNVVQNRCDQHERGRLALEGRWLPAVFAPYEPVRLPSDPQGKLRAQLPFHVGGDAPLILRVGTDTQRAHTSGPTGRQQIGRRRSSRSATPRSGRRMQHSGFPVGILRRVSGRASPEPGCHARTTASSPCGVRGPRTATRRDRSRSRRLFMSSSNRPYGFTCVQNSGDRARRSASVSLAAHFGSARTSCTSSVFTC